MGKDKIFLHVYDGATFIEHLYNKAACEFDRVIISAGSKEHGERIAHLLPNAEVVMDLYEAIGPMGGILSVFEQTGLSHFAVIPADVPNAELKVLSFFLEKSGTDACLLKEGKFAEPLIAAYGEDALHRMQTMVQNGNYRMQDVPSEKTVFYCADELKEEIPELKDKDLAKAFFNINTEQEYIEQIK